MSNGEQVEYDSPIDALEAELEEVRKSKDLNNFRALLPGGFRRFPTYLDPDVLSPESLARLAMKFGLIDVAISELGLDPNAIESGNRKILGARIPCWETQDPVLKEQLIKISQAVEDEFFDMYEYPIYERLRRSNPNLDINWTS